jgi:uncharacterized protein YdaU (DUF1376 family)
LKRKG